MTPIPDYDDIIGRVERATAAWLRGSVRTLRYRWLSFLVVLALTGALSIVVDDAILARTRMDAGKRLGWLARFDRRLRALRSQPQSSEGV